MTNLAPGTTKGIPWKSISPSTFSIFLIANAKIPGDSFLSLTHSASKLIGIVSTINLREGLSFAILS